MKRLLCYIVYTFVFFFLEPVMTQRIGVRELREKLSLFFESSETLEVTRHGQTIGFFIPVSRRPGQAQREALLEAGKRMDAGSRYFCESLFWASKPKQAAKT